MKMMNSNGHAVDDLEGQNLKKKSVASSSMFCFFFLKKNSIHLNPAFALKIWVSETEFKS